MKHPNSRRGMGIAAVVLLLAVINIAAIGSVVASGDEAEVGAMQVKTAQAFYAAESGAVIIVRCTNAGLTMPVAGAEITLGDATLSFTQVPTAGAAGEAIVDGVSGPSVRRVKVTLDDL